MPRSHPVHAGDTLAPAVYGPGLQQWLKDEFSSAPDPDLHCQQVRAENARRFAVYLIRCRRPVRVS